jgi:hypothetical protein
MRCVALLVTALLLAAAAATASSHSWEGHSKLQLKRAARELFPSATAVHTFIVVVRAGVSTDGVRDFIHARHLEAQSAASSSSAVFHARVDASLQHVLNALVVALSAEAVRQLLEHSDVLYIEDDAAVWGVWTEPQPDAPVGVDLDMDPAFTEPEFDIASFNATEADGDAPVFGMAVKTRATTAWALDRIDQINLPLDKTYAYDFDGAGVDGA